MTYSLQYLSCHVVTTGDGFAAFEDLLWVRLEAMVGTSTSSVRQLFFIIRTPQTQQYHDNCCHNTVTNLMVSVVIVILVIYWLLLGLEKVNHTLLKTFSDSSGFSQICRLR